jgi:hypothetical protein
LPTGQAKDDNVSHSNAQESSATVPACTEDSAASPHSSYDTVAQVWTATRRAMTIAGRFVPEREPRSQPMAPWLSTLCRACADQNDSAASKALRELRPIPSAAPFSNLWHSCARPIGTFAQVRHRIRPNCHSPVTSLDDDGRHASKIAEDCHRIEIEGSSYGVPASDRIGRAQIGGCKSCDSDAQWIAAARRRVVS